MILIMDIKKCFFFFLQELSKITVPVVFNEPLSFLQRISEYLEYAKLLEQANLSDDPVERLQVNGQKFPSILCD